MKSNNLPGYVSKIREETFKEEKLGNLGSFYKNTAQAYQLRFLEKSKELESLRQDWEKRFSAAEEALKQVKESKRFSLDPSFIDPITGKPWRISRLIGNEGKRLSYEEILKRDTSKRGNVFEVGKEAERMLDILFSTESYEKNYTSFEQNYQKELAALEQRNKESRQTFLLNKERRLKEIEQSVSPYKQATYIEKPI